MPANSNQKMLIWAFVFASVSAHFHEGFTNGGKPGGGGGGGNNNNNNGGGNKNKGNNNNNNNQNNNNNGGGGQQSGGDMGSPHNAQPVHQGKNIITEERYRRLHIAEFANIAKKPTQFHDFF